MYELLVVDDEQYAVEGVVEAIDWTSIGVTSVHGANSVEEAKEIMTRHPADVIICDIEMAGENGLDFLKWVRNGGYPAKLIFLTAYARFEYAQESIGLGASEFLIKPVDHDILKSTVEQVLQQYQDDADLQQRALEYEKLKKMWEAQLPAFRNRLWLDVLEKPEAYVDQDSLHNMLTLYNIELSEGRLSMLLVHSEWNAASDDKENSVRLYRICDIAQKVLLTGDGEVITVDTEHCVVVFYNPIDCTEEKIGAFTAVVTREMDCELECYVSGNISYTDINKAYEQMRASENRRSFSDRHFVFKLSEEPSNTERTIPSMEILNAYMEIGKREELKRVIGEFLSSLDGSRMEVRDNLRVMYYRLISAAITLLHSRGENLNRQLHSQLFDESVCDTICVFHSWSDALIDHVVPNLTRNAIPSLIQAVKDYICHNINRELTRESIANEVFLNPSYLSRLFHKETGEKLSDYILRMRIGRARELLENTDEKITMISEQIGYSNDSYFIKTFKSVTGMTPYEYRKECRRNREV